MPRGSNNRLDEANRDRANGNRLFDSQNNNRGGYNVGSVYYTQGSTVYSQWTNQHSCGAANNDCEFVIQYMCDPWLRDGTTTDRIPLNDDDCYEYDCDKDLEYGRQESQEWYQLCRARKRNMGLFTANQNLNNIDATRTRQNPDGTRRGYECPEERDYYPYWYPTPWKDIAVMTNDPTRCAAYQEQSENVLGRWYCDVPQEMFEEYTANNVKGWIPTTEEECLQIYYIPEGSTGNATWANWVQSEPHNIPAPHCTQNWWSRDNHLGNVIGGYMSMYNWTMPTDWTDENCAFRMRYNITTSEYPAWESATGTGPGVDWRNNSEVNNPNANEDPAEIKIWEDFYFTREDVAPSFDQSTNNNANGLLESREYVLKNNPAVDIFGSILTNTPGEAKLQLNINTNQFGRTFQDRSHRFALRANSAECAETVTHNLQVRGKRGNVVQTYPGMEYDFVPEHLKVQNGECVHIQWTGSNTNPNNNAGQGRQGTDRHNMVQLRFPNYDEDQGVTNPPTYGQFGNQFPAKIQDTSFLGWSDEVETHLAILSPQHMGGELSELDDAPTYFDLGPKKVTQTGIWHYFCTRANNFSNRSEKGKIDVTETSAAYGSVGWEGGEVVNYGAIVAVPEGSVTQPVAITVETQQATTTESSGKVKSDFVAVYLDGAASVTVTIPYQKLSVFGHKVMYHEDHTNRDVDDGSWVKVRDVDYGTSEHSPAAIFATSQEGVYVVAKNGLSWGWVLFLVIVFGGALGASAYFGNKRFGCIEGGDHRPSPVSTKGDDPVIEAKP